MKIPEPKKLASGNYFIQLRLGGKSISITDSSRRECIRRAQLIKAEYGAKKPPKTGGDGLTFAQAIDRYCADKSKTLSPATLRGYKMIAKWRFQSIADIKMHDVANWQKIINQEAELCSPKTLKNAWGLVQTVMRYVDIEPPRVTLPQVMPPDTLWLDDEQIKTFVEAVKGKPCEIPALFALHSLTRSEMLDLKWTDVDLKAGTIKVHGAAVVDENGKLVHKSENKNAGRHRVVPIMVPALTEALTAAKHSGEYIINANYNAPYEQINRVCKAAGLPPVGVHGLRRSFASLAYHLGWSERMTMAIGGWTDPKVMHQLYIKLSQKDKIAATVSMADFYKSKKANANENANVIE